MSATRRPTKNEKRRSKKKENNSETPALNQKAVKDVDSSLENSAVAPSQPKVEYVSVDYNVDDDPLLEEFKAVFEKFTKPEELLSKVVANGDNKENSSGNGSTVNDSIEVADAPKLSKKKKKLMSRLSAAQLKQLVARPDAVEAHDVTSSDPRLLIHLKSYRNTVPVPRHWCAIRKYLQGKRGVEKIPFQLPEFIADTGIAKIRDSLIEQEALKKGKQKSRERMKPKMGKIDIDYQVLHDAFFKYQTKPKMTGHGDLYFEGKEFEVNVKERRPGVLSADLIAALGMQDGGPPPWLVNMQRYGLPPSYPNLRIPGLNAPLPPGAVFGFHPGGWGKPPTDEYGAPLYGDVFGISGVDDTEAYAHIDKTSKWGVLDPEQEVEQVDSESEDEEEEEEEAQVPVKRDVRVNRRDTSGLETPNTIDGISSTTSSMETSGVVDLRKRAGIETPDTVYGGDHSSNSSSGGRELYKVIQEKQVTGISAGGQMFGSDRTYVVNGGKGGGGGDASVNPDDVEAMMNSAAGRQKAGTASVADSENGGSKKRKAELSSAATTKKLKDFF